MNDQDLRTSVDFFRAQLESWPLPGLVPVLARLLAAGEPVTVADVAKAGGWTPGQAREALSRHPGTDWDAEGRVLGFGLTLRPTPHSFAFDGGGGTVYGFCASDTLAFPVLLGRPGAAGSSCPVTGQPIRVGLDPERVLRIDPPQAVVSKVRPAQALADIRAEACALGHFFAAADAAAGWLAQYPHGQVVPVAEDFEITRQTMVELGWALNR
jgi:alkylmercury lyase